jgi:VWFA-related protein
MNGNRLLGYLNESSDALRVQAPQSAVRVSVNLVMVDATVKSKDGKIMADLKKDDFELREDGVVQKLEVFSRDELPLNVAIVLDLSDSMGPFLLPLREATTICAPQSMAHPRGFQLMD